MHNDEACNNKMKIIKEYSGDTEANISDEYQSSPNQDTSV